MRVFICLIAIMFFVFSCQKEKQINKKLAGDWTVNKVRIEDGEGFTFFDNSPDGTFNFSSNSNNITSLVSYKYINFEGYEIKDTFQLNVNKYEFNTSFDRINILISSDTINARLILLTRKSMELEYYDLQKYRLVRFILSKD